MDNGWRVSSFSGTNGNCTEVASGNGAVLVRDTVDRDGATLCIPAAAWQEFVQRVR